MKDFFKHPFIIDEKTRFTSSRNQFLAAGISCYFKNLFPKDSVAVSTDRKMLWVKRNRFDKKDYSFALTEIRDTFKK